MEQTKSNHRHKSKKSKLRRGKMIKQLGLFMLHQWVVLGAWTYDYNHKYRPIRKASNFEIGRFEDIFNVGINWDDYPFIIPKNLKNTQILEFRGQSGGIERRKKSKESYLFHRMMSSTSITLRARESNPSLQSWNPDWIRLLTIHIIWLSRQSLALNTSLTTDLIQSWQS